MPLNEKNFFKWKKVLFFCINSSQIIEFFVQKNGFRINVYDQRSLHLDKNMIDVAEGKYPVTMILIIVTYSNMN